ncbi:hypothetical protein ACF0H5_014676 [Mactra antiquata]
MYSVNLMALTPSIVFGRQVTNVSNVGRISATSRQHYCVVFVLLYTGVATSLVQRLIMFGCTHHVFEISQSVLDASIKYMAQSLIAAVVHSVKHVDYASVRLKFRSLNLDKNTHEAANIF